MSTIRDALEVSAEMYKKDANNVSDYVQRHLISLSIWEELRYVLLVIPCSTYLSMHSFSNPYCHFSFITDGISL